MTATLRLKIAILGLLLGLTGTMAAGLLGYATARSEAPAITAPDVADTRGLPRVVTPQASPAAASEPDVSMFEAKWRGGQFVAAGVLAVFLVLAFLVKVDKKRAFYYSSGLLVIGTVVEAIVAGRTPTYEMLMMAGLMLVAILVKGPELAPPKAGGS